MSKMYRHYSVNRMTANAKKIIDGLFDFYMENPTCLPYESEQIVGKISKQKELAIIVSDYIAGMTDRFAIREHRRLFAIEEQPL